VKRVLVGGWRKAVGCSRGHTVEIFFTLPDYGDASALYQCLKSGDLVAVSPDAEQYIGPVWDIRRSNESCPTCGDTLALAPRYPETFRCPICGTVNKIELDIDRYPDEEDRSQTECWDPYR
jgi:ribosomal protein S27AE